MVVVVDEEGNDEVEVVVMVLVVFGVHVIIIAEYY